MVADAILMRDNNPVYEIIILERIPSGFHGIMKRISGDDSSLLQFQILFLLNFFLLD